MLILKILCKHNVSKSSRNDVFWRATIYRGKHKKGVSNPSSG